MPWETTRKASNDSLPLHHFHYLIFLFLNWDCLYVEIFGRPLTLTLEISLVILIVLLLLLFKHFIILSTDELLN